MKIAIFGATGHTGQFILRDVLSAGHSASVLVRNPSKLPPGKYNMTIHLGDATDSDNVEDTIFGQQAGHQRTWAGGKRPSWQRGDSSRPYHQGYASQSCEANRSHRGCGHFARQSWGNAY